MKCKIVYTNHVKQRIRLRKLSKVSIEETLHHPERKYPATNDCIKYIKQMGSKRYHVIARYNPQQQAMVVISAWIRGEDDPPSIIWRLITAPFKLIAWLWRLIFKRQSKRHK